VIGLIDNWLRIDMVTLVQTPKIKIRYDQMTRCACSTHKTPYNILVRKPERKSQCGNLGGDERVTRSIVRILNTRKHNVSETGSISAFR
jgi:hypothetical protein